MRRSLFVPVLLLALTACSTGGMDVSQAKQSNTPQYELLAGSSDARGDLGEIDSVRRKMIKTGSVSIRVREYGPFEDELTQWLSAKEGFISGVSVYHEEGEVGSASLGLRVPAADMDELVSWLEREFEIVQLDINSADVTEEWVDLEARLKNTRRTEARLQEILGHGTGNLADVLAVERELSRVRGEIEAAEARYRVLDNQVSLATLSLSVSVDQPYHPPQTPTFMAQMGQTWSRSLQGMASVARGAVLLFVAAFPWLATIFGFLGTVSVAVFALLRRRLA